MEKEFRFWMHFFGKLYSDFKLLKGDFFCDEEFVDLERVTEDGVFIKRRLSMNDYVKEVINESRLIFVNNYAFGAAVDHQLKLRFLDMLEGSIIVSSKPFCPLNFRINDRNLNGSH
jgi:H3 lysine-79-specific histone-lysine N-methyltransferase